MLSRALYISLLFCTLSITCVYTSKHRVVRQLQADECDDPAGN